MANSRLLTLAGLLAVSPRVAAGDIDGRALSVNWRLPFAAML